MSIYTDLLKEVMETGVDQPNRTDEICRFIPGAILKYDLQKGFPVDTTRKVPWRSAIQEMKGFLSVMTNAQDFADIGCRYWFDNANGTPAWLNSPYRKGENDLGEIYGYFWRHWVGDDGTVIDQVADALNKIHTDPTNRRIIVNGWKVEAIKQGRGALPPCHIAWHIMCDVKNKEMSLCMWQRSCDMTLGIPSNTVEYAFLLTWIARITGYKPRWLVMHLDDVHVYGNHFEGVREQLTREPRAMPQLVIPDHWHEFHRDGFDIEAISRFDANELELIGYEPHEPIKYEMVK